MIRHFLSAFFFAFIGFVIFVNLFQYSGAIIPFDNAYTALPDMQEGVFGFSSLINFSTEVQRNPNIANALNNIELASTIIKEYTIDQLIKVFNSAHGISSGNYGAIIFKVIVNLVSFIIVGLVNPLAFIFSLALLLGGVIQFIWEIVDMFFKFLFGYYNVVPVSSGLLDSINYIPPVLQATMFVLV